VEVLRRANADDFIRTVDQLGWDETRAVLAAGILDAVIIVKVMFSKQALASRSMSFIKCPTRMMFSAVVGQTINSKR
jgi:hypothetical protein